MVHLTCANCLRKYSKDFVGKLRIYVRGGSGGMGLPSLGGRGGKGGDVYLVASVKDDYTLKGFKKKYPTKRFVADPGENSSTNNLAGRVGASIYVQVPHGVTVVDAEKNTEIGEILKPNDKLLVATGGKGGSYHTKFNPRKGSRRVLSLDLKLIADVGFVGFPNAGKSTLLSALSKAKPKIADYPFTTLKPELGIIEYEDLRKVQLADLPGLIEGAHQNLGRGHSFLMHIERTRVLLFVVDITGFKLSQNSQFRNAFQTIQLLTKELELYNDEMVDKKSILVVNKMDEPNSDKLFEEMMDQLANYKDHLSSLPDNMTPTNQPEFKHIIPISCLAETGLGELKTRIREIVDDRKLILDKNISLSDGNKKITARKEKELKKSTTERIIVF